MHPPPPPPPNSLSGVAYTHLWMSPLLTLALGIPRTLQLRESWAFIGFKGLASGEVSVGHSALTLSFVHTRRLFPLVGVGVAQPAASQPGTGRPWHGRRSPNFGLREVQPSSCKLPPTPLLPTTPPPQFVFPVGRCRHIVLLPVLVAPILSAACWLDSALAHRRFSTHVFSQTPTPTAALPNQSVFDSHTPHFPPLPPNSGAYLE